MITKAETHIQISDVATFWGVSRTSVEALPFEILPYVNVTPASSRVSRRYNPAEVRAAGVRLHRWKAAIAQGQGEKYLRQLRQERETHEKNLLMAVQKESVS